MAAALEGGIHEQVDHIAGEAVAHDPLAETEDVGVVVHTGHTRREGVLTASGTDALVLIGGDGHANARTADQNAQVGLSRGKCLAQGIGVYGIVAGLRGVGAYVQDLEAASLQMSLDLQLQLERFFL